MRNLSTLIVMVVALTACAQQTGGKASTDELGKSVVAALAAKDEAGMLALGANVEQRAASCPKLGEDRQKLATEREQAETKLSSAFANCTKIDWSNATVVAAKGGAPREPIADCPDFVPLKDVHLTVDVGGKQMMVRLDDPVSLGGKIFLDGLQCAGGATSPPSIAATVEAAQKVCACKTLACASEAATSLAKIMKEKPIADASPEDARLVGKATQEMQACLKKLQAEAPPTPQKSREELVKQRLQR